MDDNDGLVEDVVEENLASSEPNILTKLFSLTITTVESYGWFILIAGIILYYLYTIYQKQAKESRSISSNKKIDPELELKRMQAIEAARQKQEAALNAAKEKYLEEKRLKEEREIKERAEDWERHKMGLGYKGKTKKTEDSLEQLGLSDLNKSLKKKDDKSKLRPNDYNPLTGTSSNSSGGSCSWRPAKRGGASGG